MSERREEGEEERGVMEEEEEEEETTNTEPGGAAAEEPPEDDEEEVQRDRSTSGEAEAAPAEQPGDARTTENAGTSTETGETTSNDPAPDTCAGVPEPDAGTRANREPQATGSAGNATATVTVALVPEGHVMTAAFAIGLSIRELKRRLAAELQVPAEVLRVSLDGRVVEEHQSLMELGVRPHGSTRLEMSSADPSAHPLHPLRPPEHDHMPDVLTVRVQTGDGACREVVVEIERPPQQKAFAGGYRHRLTGAEFHHAAVQTTPKRRPERGVAVVSRDTQTVQQTSQAQQCAVDASTQMTGIGCYVSCAGDRLVAPGDYVTADERLARRLRAAIRLQALARRWLARQEVERLRRERARRLAWLDAQEQRRREEKEAQLRDRRQRWTNPRRREDFNLLYHAVEKWRCEEEQRINSSLRGAERRAALRSLLEEETQVIAAIGRHRAAVHNDNHDKTIRNFLDKCAAPRQWRASDGRLLQMDTEHTVRARQLRDLYHDANRPPADPDQRVHVLTTLRRTVTEHDCQLTRDIAELVDREQDLAGRGVKAANLEGLRRRISALFLQFIRTPAFNPEAAKLLPVPQSPSQLKDDVFLCRSCRRYLRAARFGPAAGGRPGGRCRDCAGLDNVARARDDFSCYENILRRLRDDERRLNRDAKIPFLLQVEDMRYLVEAVWASRSALSANDDLYDLAFVRWERGKDWSPWNCVLLSKEETSAHLEGRDVHQTYETTFVRWVEHKHRLARRHFSRVPAMAEHLTSETAPRSK